MNKEGWDDISNEGGGYAVEGDGYVIEGHGLGVEGWND